MNLVGQHILYIYLIWVCIVESCQLESMGKVIFNLVKADTSYIIMNKFREKNLVVNWIKGFQQICPSEIILLSIALYKPSIKNVLKPTQSNILVENPIAPWTLNCAY